VTERRTGVLLVNLGTPRSPRVSDVRRFLREFLMDPRVVDLPPVARWLLVNVVIAPLRPFASARAYRQVWTEAGSPLLVHGRALRDRLAETLGATCVVELGMRYGEPSIGRALERLHARDVERIVALPLFPQYAPATTGSVERKIVEERGRLPRPAPVQVLPAFPENAGFVEALAETARRALTGFHPDHWLFSFHGLPERQVLRADPSGRHCLRSETCCDALGDVNRDCYRAQCFATGRALARALALPEDAWSVSFQSRLGRTPWIGPYTDAILPELRERGVRRLAVACPSFVADCLETLEEIGIRAREQWRELGGEDLRLVPCLNAEPVWVQAVARRLRSQGRIP